MNLRNLRYFCAAFEERSTVGAARVCHVTQPAISNAIAQLEEELGVRLFARQQRGMEPTAAAVRLYRMGGKLLADAQAIAESFVDPALHPRFSLRVQPSLSIDHVRRLLRHWRQALGHLELSVLDGEEPVDAVLTVQSCVPDNMQFMPLWEEHYVLVVPEEHPLAGKAVIEPQDLHGVPFIERTYCELSEAWRQAVELLKIVPEVRARASSEEWALGLVAAGVGVTVAPLHAAAVVEGVVVRSEMAHLPATRRVVGLAYHPADTGVLPEILAACEQWAGVMAQPAARTPIAAGLHAQHPTSS